jgi:hypothetical protein
MRDQFQMIEIYLIILYFYLLLFHSENIEMELFLLNLEMGNYNCLVLLNCLFGRVIMMVYDRFKIPDIGYSIKNQKLKVFS